jgi:hypothetical protein
MSVLLAICGDESSLGPNVKMMGVRREAHTQGFAG